MKLTAAIENVLNAAADKYGLERAFVRGVARVESAFNPRAVSSAGAMGLMQLMPATAEGLGVSDPFDPWQNANAGAKYLAALLERFNNYAQAIAAYNWGPTRVVRKPAEQQWPAQIRSYVRKVFDAMAAELARDEGAPANDNHREIARPSSSSSSRATAAAATGGGFFLAMAGLWWLSQRRHRAA